MSQRKTPVCTVSIAGLMVFALSRIDAAGPSVPAGAELQTRKECSSCHMAYPPELLPMRSWQKIMSDLANHFGESAALPEPTRAAIEAYLIANAGDAPGAPNGSSFIDGIPADATPLRITDTPVWKSIHEEIPDQFYANSRLTSKANSLACHTTTGQDQGGE